MCERAKLMSDSNRDEKSFAAFFYDSQRLEALGLLASNSARIELTEKFSIFAHT